MTGGGGPATGRDRARGTGAAGRPCRLGDHRARISGNRLSNGLSARRERRRCRGGCAGRVRQGVPRARALPPRRAAQAVAAADRGERGEEPAACGRQARGARRACGRRGPPGGRGPVPRRGSARGRVAPAAAGSGRASVGRAPRRDRVPLLPRALRRRDGGGARGSPRDGEVEALASAGAAARRAGGDALSELERQLIELGRGLDVPVAPDLAPRVLGRLEGRRPFPWRPLVVALAVVVVAVAIAFAVPPARSAILRLFHLGGASVVGVETLPPAVERSQADGLGDPLTRDAAERRVGFELVLPPAARRVYVLGDSLASVVVRAYGRPVLVSEFPGQGQFLEKLVAGRTDVERLRVDGEPGLWLEGAPHVLQYFDRRRGFREEPILVRGNVLLWARGRVTLRLEGTLTKAQALELAHRLG